jgi:hypothetical protein
MSKIIAPEEKQKRKEARAKDAAAKRAQRQHEQREEHKKAKFFRLMSTHNPQKEAWFADYNSKYPEIWEGFKMISDAFIQKGYNKVGADWIIAIMRWKGIIKNDDNRDFALNNDAIAYYSRKWLKDNWDEHWDFFEIRNRTRSSHDITDDMLEARPKKPSASVTPDDAEGVGA